MISKVNLKDTNGNPLLIKGKMYEIEQTPKMCESITFQQVHAYIVRGEKNQFFKIDINHFISIEDMRNDKINKILE